MPGRSVWLRVLGLVGAVLEGMFESPDGSLVAMVRTGRRQRQRRASAGWSSNNRSNGAHPLRLRDVACRSACEPLRSDLRRQLPRSVA